jgi:nucleotide-binding universal stress UspA family protein
MYTRLLVALDGTPESEVALSPARTLAAALGAQLSLLRVVPADRTGISVVSSPELDRAYEYLEAVADTLRGSGAAVEVDVEVVVAQGSPAEAILAEADRRGANLIVLATHGRNGIDKLVIGSVSERVVQRSKLPVLLLRPTKYRAERLKLILVPVDGSTGSLVALGTASHLARAANAALVLLRVVLPLPLWIYDPALGLDTGPLIDPRWDEDRRANAEAYVRQVARQVAESGIEAGAEALLGDVAATITEYADQEAVDLIVMATHARRGPTKALLGSMAADVIRAAQQPVLLVHRPFEGEDSHGD